MPTNKTTLLILVTTTLTMFSVACEPEPNQESCITIKSKDKCLDNGCNYAHNTTVCQNQTISSGFCYLGSGYEGDAPKAYYFPQKELAVQFATTPGNIPDAIPCTSAYEACQCIEDTANQ
jgi:hypothetical protein